MRKRAMVTSVGAVGLTVLSLGGWYVSMKYQDNPLIGSGPALGSGLDRYPSHTAEDWVTYADHVVVVTPVDEVETPPAASEIERGEGLIGRNVEMRVDKVLWSRDDAPKPAPTSYTRQSTGWVFDGDVKNRRKFVLEGRPRIELGHSYVIALRWEPTHCSEGDKPDPAQWVGLGEGSNLPFDEGVIGMGEFAGTVRPAPTVARNQADHSVEETPLAEALAGRGEEELVEALESATPVATPARPGSASPRSSVPAEAC